MNETLALLDLPVQTLVVLAAGYLGYRLAYTGHDEAHGPADVVFISLFFAAIARATIAFAGAGPLGLVGAVAAALGTAAAWRSGLATWLWRLTGRAGINSADRTRTALGSVLATSPVMTQIVVRKRDGSVLMSSPLHRFDNSPIRSCVLGADGSVALYVTAFRSKDGEWQDVEAEVCGWGRRLTIVPADQIAEIEITT